MAENIQYRRLRAPAEHGGALIDPPLSQSAAIISQNIESTNSQQYDFQGRSYSELSNSARIDLVVDAQKYSATYCDINLKKIDHSRLILSGHQPQLFHPGVWVKNFAISNMAQNHQAVAVNMVIDNDLAKNRSIRVPSGNPQQPILKQIAFDSENPDTPHELSQILDHDLFQSFGHRVADSIQPFVADPLITQFWPMVIRRSREVNNLGLSIAQARHQYENQLGLQTLELPLSKICETDSFYWFVTHLLANLPRFWDTYNQSIQEYRNVHQIKNMAQPVPNLKIIDDWLEAPFWIYSPSEPTRERLFVRCSGDQLLLSNRKNLEFSLPITADSTAEKAVEALRQQKNVLIRPRAMMTTMYARIFLADLFIHGIGGAKYDQITDLIINRFFGFTPPEFLTISATAHLPIGKTRISRNELLNNTKHLRELKFCPEQQIQRSDQTPTDQQVIDELINQKKEVLKAPTSRSRHLNIIQINQNLQKYLSERRNELLNNHQQISKQLQLDNILFSREYSFCLFPESLSDLLLEIIHRNP